MARTGLKLAVFAAILADSGPGVDPGGARESAVTRTLVARHA